jgi:hypothetical protein
LSVASSSFQTLIDAGKAYLAQGYSVLPLYAAADPSRPKTAAVAWSRFQRERAIPLDLARWFLQERFCGLAIVTGEISSLCVLDFDDPQLQQAFAETHPDLVATRTVLTRRGKHLYYALPPSLHVASRKLAGIDLLGEGRYVVAPPTVIDGYQYTVVNTIAPKLLTRGDLERINGFVDQQARKRATRGVDASDTPYGYVESFKGVERLLAPSTRTPEPSADTIQLLKPSLALLSTVGDLQAAYRHFVTSYGRNEALFRVALMARDHNWSAEGVNQALLDLHAQQQPVGQHRKETRPQRYLEGLRTVQSAFSRPARPQLLQQVKQLCNSIRERLLAWGQTYVLRVIEALRMAGIKAGQQFGTAQAWKLLKGLIGRDSIYNALNAKTPDGQFIFQRTNPSPRPPTHEASASPLAQGQTTNAIVWGKKSGISPQGRPKRCFIMPTNEELCALLSVQTTGSDPIAQDDVRSAKLTRQAVHRELIKRKAGHYSTAWLAERLGVCEVTLRHYNQQIEGLHCVPTFTQTTLNWWNLNALPPAEWLEPGMFLESADGRRFPALKAIAMKLLAQGRGVKLLTQTMNYYWYGDDTLPPVSSAAARLKAEIGISQVEKGREAGEWRNRIDRFVRMIGERVRTQETPTQELAATVNAGTAASQGQVAQNGSVPVAPPNLLPSKPKRSPHFYWKSLPDLDHEALAVKVYQRVNQASTAQEHRVSMATARKWVDVYGTVMVTTALDLLEKRQNIHKSVGFVATFLRSTSRFAGMR